MRKIIIGLIAVAFVALMFFVYAVIMDPAPMKAPAAADVQDIDMPEIGNGDRQAGDSAGRDVGEAQYVVLDPETNEIQHVLGFKELLNPGAGTSRWQVEEPYIIFYETDFKCRIESDKGIFQVESGGSRAAPKDAQLDGNVKIHITPEPGGKMSETFIKMDDIAFSSERSELATDGPVSIQSDQVELEGFGLILFFDTADSRIDYLHIRDLEVLRILNVPKSGQAADTKDQSPLAGGTTFLASKDVEDSQADEAPPSEYYQCILEDNVKIEYGDELVVTGAEQINIQNILFSKLGDSAATDESPEPVVQKAEKTEKSPSGSKTSAETPVPSGSGNEVVVTCDGGIILKPMQDKAGTEITNTIFNGTADVRYAQPDGPVLSPAVHTANLAGQSDAAETAMPDVDPAARDVIMESDSKSTQPAKFDARKIDYDYTAGSGLAHGPVRFTFHLPADPNTMTDKPRIPVTITADKNVQFIPDESHTIRQVVFNENVLATRRSQLPEFVQLDNFHSDKLTVFLDENAESKTDVSRVTLTEGKVYAQSQRLKGEQAISTIELSCKEIAYSRTDDEIVAKGPGEIQWNNSHVPDPNASEEKDGIDFTGPCYVYIDGFDQIQWNLTEEKIVADGQQDQLKLAYVPLVDGKPDKFIFVNSIRFELDFMTDPAGETALKRVFTDRPIAYEELNHDRTQRLRHIVGGMLDYDTTDGNGWLRIEGTPDQPCRVDGAPMQFVYIHPLTGQVEASLSTTPGLLNP
ncbi:MAG: hypothetical protein ABFR90_01100 [Planctomycetota bacterium]